MSRTLSPVHFEFPLVVGAPFIVIWGIFPSKNIALDWKGGPKVGRLLLTGGYRSNAKWSTLFCCQHCSLSSVQNGFSLP
jgi:hypothetical protein